MHGLSVESNTYDRAEKTQASGVPFSRVSRTVPPGRRQWYAQADGAVKLAPPGLHSDHGAKVGLIAEQLCNQLIWNWLSLGCKAGDGTTG